MKKTLLILLGAIIAFTVNSQAPQAFKYQAVVRDNTGSIISEQSVNFQIDILKGSVDGSTVFSETHTEQTTSVGMVSLEIGNGTTTDDFSAIEWGTDSYFIKLWVNGNEMGTSQLLSVPYAMHAHSAEVFTGTEIKNLADPTDDQDVATKAYVDMQITNPGIRINGTVEDIVCFDDNSGSIDLTVAGGTPPYEFEWSNDSTTEDLSGLEQGKYQIYVVDKNGMSSFRQFTVHQSDELYINYSMDFGTGAIDVTVIGGKAPYTFAWSNGATTEDLSGVSQGIYTVEVTDANGCSVSEEIEMIKEAMVLAEYLESAESPLGYDYVNTALPAIKTAEHVKTLNTAGMVHIIDIRSADVYAAGHIENSVNVAAGDVLAYIESNDLSQYDEISIVGYTGQTSGWLTTLLRLAGYDNIYALKWGMCSWHQDFAGSWNNNIGNGYASQFTADPTVKGPLGDLPTLSTGGASVQEILEARVEAVLAEGFGEAKVRTEVFDSPDNYYIINYWPESDYVMMGHIQGAIQYTPKASLQLDADLKTLPTDKTIAVYDYTGQTSAGLVAYLRVLGYDAKSILFGTNGLIYDDMTKSKWSEAAIMGYEYVGSTK